MCAQIDSFYSNRLNQWNLPTTYKLILLGLLVHRIVFSNAFESYGALQKDVHFILLFRINSFQNRIVMIANNH